MNDKAATIGENIRRIMEKNGYNVHSMSKAIGVDSAPAYKWVKGLSEPKSYNLYLMAKLFNVPMEAFIEGGGNMTEVLMYGFRIGTDEYYKDIHKGAEKFTSLRQKANPYYVYKEPNGEYQVFLFETESERDEALKVAMNVGYMTAKKMYTSVYVDVKYVESKRSGQGTT